MEVFKCGCLDLTGVLCTGAAGLGGQAGVAWPAGVDPNRREAYLSKQEFVQEYIGTRVVEVGDGTVLLMSQARQGT
eukprot:1179984-Prorocentrum_minimum.AAC.4